MINRYRSLKRALFPRVRLGYERFKQFFLLPGWYRKVRAYKDCTKPGWSLASDLLTWFFSYKTLPTHYGLDRLWEIDRGEWKYYYGSNYLPHQQARLRKRVEPLEYRVLFNDKYVCVLLCQALGIRVPRTHGMLDPDGRYRALIGDWLAASSSNRLIIKPLGGSSGRDIVLAENDGSGTVIRSRRSAVPLEQYVLKEKAIVQDYLTQHPGMAVFSPSSVNTVRVVTLLTPQDDILIVDALVRTGIGQAFIDNWGAGGVAAGIDCLSGRVKKDAYDKKGNRYTAHPTSGVVFEDFQIPAWKRFQAFSVMVQRAFSFFPMLGLDLALGMDGEPVLIELNHGPDIAGMEQICGPLLRNEPVLRAFGDYDLLVNKHQKRLYAGLAKSASRPEEHIDAR